jgi:hypothetical protein
VLAGGETGQVGEREGILWLEFDHPLERLLRIGQRSSESGALVVQHLAELEPRLDLLRTGGDDCAIEPLCLNEITATGREESIQQLSVVDREPPRVAGGLFRTRGRKVRPGGVLRRDAQPEPGERKGAVVLGRPFQSADGRVVPACPER